MRVPSDEPTALGSRHDTGIVVMRIDDVKHLLGLLRLERQESSYTREVLYRQLTVQPNIKRPVTHRVPSFRAYATGSGREPNRVPVHLLELVRIVEDWRVFSFCLSVISPDSNMGI